VLISAENFADNADATVVAFDAKREGGMDDEGGGESVRKAQHNHQLRISLKLPRTSVATNHAALSLT
jgi:hypothetical protein